MEDNVYCAMNGEQIDRLCRDWLGENYGEETASEYRIYSLVIPLFNTKDLNNALEELRQILCIIFGPEQSFGSTDYHDARERLRLPGSRTLVPDAFIRAFALS